MIFPDYVTKSQKGTFTKIAKGEIAKGDIHKYRKNIAKGDIHNIGSGPSDGSSMRGH